MTTIDPEQERRRLSESYGKRSDTELEEAAGQADCLTEVARAVLQAEITKRGLGARLVEYPAGDETELRELVTIRIFRDLPEALLAKGSLDSTGIECALGDENICRMDWLWSNAMGGIKLRVPQEQAAIAEEVLCQPIPVQFEVSGIGTYEQPQCPKCGSLEIAFQELDPAAYLSIWILPLPLQRRGWHCHSCDTQWEEDEATGDA